MSDDSISEGRDLTLILRTDLDTHILPNNDKNRTILQCKSISSILKNSTNPSSLSPSLKIFLDSLKIDYNPEVNHSYSEEIQVVEIQKSVPIYTYINSYNPFIIIKCNRITTYYVDNYMFSLLTHPEQFEEEYGIRSVIIKHRNKQFSLNDDVRLRLGDKIDISTFEEFINRVSNIYKGEAHRTTEKLHFKRIMIYVLISGCFLILVVFMLVMAFVFDQLLFDYDEGLGFWIKLVLFVLLLILLLYFCIRNLINALYVEPQIRKFNRLMNMVQSYPQLQDFLETWNKYVFVPKGLYVYIPLNIKYIHVILDLGKEIKFQNHAVNNE
jgi:hypothetical protein